MITAPFVIFKTFFAAHHAWVSCVARWEFIGLNIKCRSIEHQQCLIWPIEGVENPIIHFKISVAVKVIRFVLEGLLGAAGRTSQVFITLVDLRCAPIYPLAHVKNGNTLVTTCKVWLFTNSAIFLVRIVTSDTWFVLVFTIFWSWNNVTLGANTRAFTSGGNTTSLVHCFRGITNKCRIATLTC